SRGCAGTSRWPLACSLLPLGHRLSAGRARRGLDRIIDRRAADAGFPIAPGGCMKPAGTGDQPSAGSPGFINVPGALSSFPPPRETTALPPASTPSTAVISDIHGNAEALRQVLADID